MAITSVTATIEAGQSLSNSADYGLYYVVGLIMPADWTAAHLSVQVSTDNVKFFDLFSFNDLAGSTSPMEFKCNVVPNAIVALDPNRMSMGKYLKLRSGTRDESVAQEASRVFTVITNSKSA